MRRLRTCALLLTWGSALFVQVALAFSGLYVSRTLSTYYNRVAAPYCGSPVSFPTWTDHSHVRQQFQRCQIRARLRIVTPTAAIPATLRPSATAIPTAVPPPTPWPTLIPSATPVPSDDPVQRLLGEINTERASHGYAPLTLSSAMSNGSGSCMGAIGHAQSMAQQGAIGHWDFPGDVCYSYYTAGENVGVSGGSESQAVDAIQQGMLSEPWSPGCSGNHHCNEDSLSYTHIGLAIALGTYSGWPAYYVSEEFAG